MTTEAKLLLTRAAASAAAVVTFLTTIEGEKETSPKEKLKKIKQAATTLSIATAMQLVEWKLTKNKVALVNAIVLGTCVAAGAGIAVAEELKKKQEQKQEEQ